MARAAVEWVRPVRGSGCRWAGVPAGRHDVKDTPQMNATMKLMALAALAGSGAVAHAAGDAEHGRALYQARCTACHSLDYNGIGPAHHGVYGRAAGKAPGYAYSDALKSLHLTWNDGTLDRWLADPEQVAPGQRMGVNVPDAQERADLIAYLKQAAAAK